MVMIAVARFQEDIPACFYLEFASSPPSCSAIIAAMMRIRLPKFGVQKTCAVAKCQILLHVLFLRIWLLWPSLPTISSVTYGQAKPPAKAFFRAGSTSELRSNESECPHSRLSRPCHQGYLFRRDTRNNISMLSKATAVWHTLSWPSPVGGGWLLITCKLFLWSITTNLKTTTPALERYPLEGRWLRKSKRSLWFHLLVCWLWDEGFSGLKTSQVLESLKAFLKKNFFQGWGQ